MAAITANLVKELRDKTGAGMMDCKAALGETGGDLDAATDWLRKKGLAAAAKKAGRVAAEGLVGAATADRKGALVEVNSETDFVARNELFQEFVAQVARVALAEGGDLAALTAARLDDGKTVQETLTELVARIGENLTLRRAAALTVGNGVVASYVHNAAAPGLGRIGVLVALESDGDKTKLGEIARQLAMHVAAANPQWLTVEDIEPEAVARERAVLMEQARASGRPDNIIEKMVEGRLRKFYEETVLTEQIYVIDTDRRVGAVVEDASKEAGAPVRLAGYIRFALGEGIERKQSDLAADVAATLGG